MSIEPPSRERIQAQGGRTADNGDHTLLVIHEADGSWTIHGLGAPGVRPPGLTMIALAKKILASTQ